MNIGIIGSGEVARTLAGGFIKYGYKVMIGTGHPEKLSGWLKENPDCLSGSFGQAAVFAELAVLAVKGTAAAEAIQLAGPENLRGKTVMDVTNPIDDLPPESGVLRFFTDLDESLLEILQNQYPGIHFVKAFNSVGSGTMINPEFPEGRPSMFICGNHEGSREIVAEIAEQFGWEAEDMGDAPAARAIEPLCMLWCIPGMLSNDWRHAFKMLR